MYFILIAIMAVWLYSLYTFAKWRMRSRSRRGFYLATVFDDRPTTIYLQTTAAVVLTMVIYII